MLISQHLPAIIKAVRENSVVSVVAGTGSGKSIGVPAAIASTGSRCFVVVPTRTAAVSLAQYQTILQKKVTPNLNVNFVGYAAEGNIQYTNDTRIAYVTGGHARKKLLSYFSKGVVKPMNFCDVLFVDEIHSGTLDTTIVISLWMKARSLRAAVPRLVIASATPVPMPIVPAPLVYTVETSGFPIDIRYHNKDLDIDDNRGALYIEASQVAFDFHRANPIANGHILIFAPGSNEVEAMVTQLTQLSSTPIAGKKLLIIPAFGALKQEDIELIYRQTTPDERKIVIATNIAETAITIADIGFVVDTMTEKRAETSLSGGFRLATHYISKDSAKQRAGRTGRTRPGIAYRMITEQSFQRLEDHRPPEIQRVPIYETIMELLAVGLTPEDTIIGIEPHRIQQAVQLLNQLGMIQQLDGNIVVTDMGHFAPKFSLSVRNAAFLWQWLQAGHPLFPGIVTAALIDSYGPSYFWLPRRNREMSDTEHRAVLEAHKDKYFSQYIGYSDLETALNMWSDMVKTLGIDANQIAIAKWSRDHSMNNKKIRELLQIVVRSMHTLTSLNHQITVGPFTTAGVTNVAKQLLLKPYSDRIMIGDARGNFFNPVTREQYRLDNRDALNQFGERAPKGIIALVTAEIQGQRGALRIVSFAVDTDVDALGKPIVPGKSGAAQRGPRTERRGIVAPLPAGQNTDINAALDLLSTLGLAGTTDAIAVTAPTVAEDNPFDLLATLQLAPVVPVQPVSIRSSTNIDNILRCWLQNKRDCVVPSTQLSGLTAQTIVAALHRASAQYPFANRYTTEAQVVGGLQTLATTVANWSTARYTISNKLNLRSTFMTPGTEQQQYLSMASDTSLDWLTEYYTEAERIRCGDLFTAWSTYDARIEATINNVLQRQQPLSLANVNKALNETIPSCRHGEVVFHTAVNKLLGLRRILDLSPAWGEHLLAASTGNADYYYGVVNDDNLLTPLRQMSGGLSEKYQVASATQPLVDLPESFDAAHIESPQDASTETIAGYVLPSVDVAWSMIRVGGFLIVEAMNVEAVARHLHRTYDDAFYCGPINVPDVLTLWIWCKYPLGSLPPSQQQEMVSLINNVRVQ
jgi:HrpA-like RNA helicase